MVLHQKKKFLLSEQLPGQVIPDYQHNNLLNLTSSILKGCGGRSRYQDIPELTSEIKSAPKIVLLVIDGMGADSLKRIKDSFMLKHQVKVLNSVFPSTTAAVITTFNTGLAPQEHGLVAWYMYLKEWDDIIAILPFWNRKKEKVSLPTGGFSFPPSLFQKIKADCFAVMKKKLRLSPYNQAFSKKVQFLGINTFGGLCRKIESIIKSPSGQLDKSKKRYIYAYWGDFDSYSHQYGKENQKSLHHLQELDSRIKQLASRLKNTNTLLLITADHGQVTIPLKNNIVLNNHPLLEECLVRPMCGEHRAGFFYVHPQKKQQFEQYAKHHLQKYCTLHPAEELVQKNYFGLFHPHRKLRQRIGDYILIAKDHYCLNDFLPGEKRKFKKGRHGGLSSEEMLVPLIKLKL